MSKLKPCPMCGATDTMLHNASRYPGDYQIVCNVNAGGCGAAGGFGTGYLGAEQKWNMRPEKKTIAYYIPGEGGFYIAPKFMNRSYIPDKHTQQAVRLVEGEEE